VRRGQGAGRASIQGIAMAGELNMALNFKQKRVVVTGGSRGIGRAIALAFATAGADVSICARGAETLERTRAELATHGGKAHAGICDLADGEAVTATCRMQPRPWAVLTSSSTTLQASAWPGLD
jgi:nucleoside-diphosphate-sugar epimerase